MKINIDEQDERDGEEIVSCLSPLSMLCLINV